MNTFIVIGITGEHYRINADDYLHQADNNRVFFLKRNKYVAVFQTDNIIGFYIEEEV